jgi:NADH dehydrogenase FAD-containing subunit
MSIPRIVLLGGGYAGVLAANRIAGRLGRRAQVTLISDRAELVHRVRLHEVIAGRRWRAYPLPHLLRRQITRVQARVVRIDRAARKVEVERDGVNDHLAFDHLVIALGSRVALDVPGAAAHAGGLASLEAALALRARIAALPDRAPIVVIGGGLTAIETAAELAEAQPRLRVTMLTSGFAPSLSEEARAYVRQVLDDLGVAVRTDVRVSDITATHVRSSGGALPAAVAIWAGGFSGRFPCATDLPLADDGRVVTDATLAVPGAAGDAGVWAIGDAAAPPPGLPFLRMACASAMPMAAHAADNVVRTVRGRAPAPFRFGFLGQCVSLGRRRGVIQRSDPRDAPTGHVYTGRTAALLKELICRYVIGALRVERRIAGSYQWPRAVLALPPGAEPRALPGAILGA